MKGSWSIRTPLLLTSALVSVVAVGQSKGKTIFHGASKSVVVIEAFDANGKEKDLGSGFALKGKEIVTNFHVIASASKLRIRRVTDHMDIPVEGVKGFDQQLDIAIIQIGTALPSLKLAGKLVAVGEPVYAIGNPNGLEDTFSSGVVSAHRTWDNRSVYQITAPLSPGSSGGPVLTGDGRVIGLATSQIEDGQNLNFAVDSQQVRDLIKRTAHDSVVDVSTLKTSPVPLKF